MVSANDILYADVTRPGELMFMECVGKAATPRLLQECGGLPIRRIRGACGMSKPPSPAG